MLDKPNQAPTAPASQDEADQARTALALSAAGFAEYEWDLARDRLFASPTYSRITGRPAGDTPARGGESLLLGVHEQDQPALRDFIGSVGAGAGEGRSELRYRMVAPDGNVRWVYDAARVWRGPRGKVVGAVRDITARKAEDDEREALVAELDHRVKNVLASVQSLAAQSARRTVSLEAFLKTFGGRLEAMAAAHTLLTATRWRGADIGHIAEAELGGLAFGQARWEGPEVVLNPRATSALTLALHELGSNAIKYGALSTDTGRVDVRWRREPDGGFTLVWTEANGPCVTAPARRGFGHDLLERVTGRELGGRVDLEFHPAGLRAVVRASASALAEPVEAKPPVESPAAATAAVLGESMGEGRGEAIGGRRVLIVEDAVLLALELEAGLSEMGANVVGVASDLEEAQRMADLAFDAAVLDANLNGESVSPVARKLASRGVPFIFATGYDEAGMAPEGFSAPIVRKPYNVRQIAAALVEAMGR